MDVHAQVERRMSRKLVGALGVHPFRPDGQQSLERPRLGRRVGVEVVLPHQLFHQLALVRALRGLSVAQHDKGRRRVEQVHLSGHVLVRGERLPNERRHVFLVVPHVGDADAAVGAEVQEQQRQVLALRLVDALHVHLAVAASGGEHDRAVEVAGQRNLREREG